MWAAKLCACRCLPSSQGFSCRLSTQHFLSLRTRTRGHQAASCCLLRPQGTLSGVWGHFHCQGGGEGPQGPGHSPGHPPSGIPAAQDTSPWLALVEIVGYTGETDAGNMAQGAQGGPALTLGGGCFLLSPQTPRCSVLSLGPPSTEPRAMAAGWERPCTGIPGAQSSGPGSGTR